MSLSIRVEDLARAVVCLDTTDLPALVRLQDELTDVASSIEDADKEMLVTVCQHAAEAIDAIVLRTTDDAEATLTQIRQSIEYAQEVVDAVSAGSDPSSVSPPAHLGLESTASAEPEIDMELLSAWVSSCSSSLSDLESAVVSIDAGDEDIGQVAESRRIIHTIKGEAGILSLGTIQEVCHDCETLIDLTIDNGGKFPVEEVLSIIDWVRACIAVLSEDPTATLPPHEELHKTIVEANQRFESGAATEENTAAEDTAAAETEQAPTDTTPEPVAEGAAAEPAAEPDVAPASSIPEQVFEGPDGPVEFPPEAVIDDTTPDFVCEAREHIANAENSLLELESDLANLDLINTVFRAFHTIKGVAGFMHLSPIVRLTHAAETLLDQARSGKLDLTINHLDLFLRSCDVLGQFIGVLQDGEPPRRSIYEKLMGHLEHACETGEAPVPHSDAPPSAAQASAVTQPPANTETPAPSEDSAVTLAPEPSPAAEPDPVTQAKTEPEAKAETVPEADQKASSQPAAEVKPVQPKAKVKSKSAARIEQTVKVNTGRMDALVDMVGELVIGYQMVHQDEAIRSVREQRTKRSLGHVAKIIRDLQEVAMSLRLVTLRSTFQKM
ncbi:Signal transduction histidine kinase CheA, partial [hydrothermal vent metagenome]